MMVKPTLWNFMAAVACVCAWLPGDAWAGDAAPRGTQQVTTSSELDLSIPEQPAGDVNERVQELEATQAETAKRSRPGVTFGVSGWVSQQVTRGQ